MKLPEEYTKKMRSLLDESEFEQFMRSYDEARYYGLRVNTLKISVDEFLRISPYKLEKVPWAKDGFYYEEGENPGRHPYYHAGLYYIQEPSAMLPGEVIDARPGERVLDLCAAPGGKTVQMAASMKGKGIIVANDINSERVKALVKNIELCGVRNAVVTNETPEKLSQTFRGYFDKILVDAPCSGEGMFRKDPDAVKSWEKFKCDRCSAMQKDILQYVDLMLKPGGVIVYSTCTFSPEENEKMIAYFLNKYDNYELADIPMTGGIECGRPEWADGNSSLSKTRRLWPHKVKGEGHFTAKLVKRDNEKTDTDILPHEKQVDSKLLKPFFDFVKDNLNTDIDGHFIVKGKNLYVLPENIPSLDGLKVAKFGWYLGEFERDSFEPSHAMVIALNKEDIKNTADFKCDSREIYGYLKGETIMVEGTKGLTGVCVDGYTVGWAKQMGDMLKNKYPKGWRKLS